ncbi:DUF2586 family protein [Cytophagaceae bacterium DM2B3-1]|uniref:DUF2586 family protein n=1 Tax=Xanthocytophaga flava TaxID=3048013 RepID=A0ABT7CKE6_9BACT|nr:DUF2586 family protein [Xanthocytophaga flavus]MDJ1494158.1 DUF2586 family protein [Xanthocytophaga flavus]
MARPNVTITKLNGGLGGTVTSKDGVSLLVISVDSTAYALGSSSYTGIQLSDFESQGFTKAKDLSNNVLVWEHIKDFYTLAPAGTELHVLVIPATTTFTQLFTVANANYLALQTYLTSKKSLIKLLGVALNPSAAETAPTAGISADLIAAIPLAQAFADNEFAKFRPIDMLLEGRKFTAATMSAATDLRTKLSPNISVMISRDGARQAELVASGHTGSANYAAVGFALGRLAGISVQVNIGRRKDGAIGWTNAHLSAGQQVVLLSDADLDALSDKGYLFVTQDTGQEGFFFNDDPTCAALDNDYCYITRNRVINKAARIARQVYVQELLDEVSVDKDTGELSALTIKTFEDAIKTAIEDQMIEIGEADAIDVYINPDQNVLANSTIEILIQIQPKGYARFLNVKLKLVNPNT